MLRVSHIPECTVGTCHIRERLLHGCGGKRAGVDYGTETLTCWCGTVGWVGAPEKMSFKDIFLLILKFSED